MNPRPITHGHLWLVFALPSFTSCKAGVSSRLQRAVSVAGIAPRFLQRSIRGSVSGRYPFIPLLGVSVRKAVPFRHFYLFAGFLPRRVYMRQRVATHLDRSDAFTPFAPSHTVQATFIAHGVPWDKSLLLIQLLQSLVNCYKVNCFQSCFSSPFVELCNLGRCPTIE